MVGQDCYYVADQGMVCEERHTLRDSSMAIVLIVMMLLTGLMQELREARPRAGVMLGCAFFSIVLPATFVVAAISVG